MFKKLYLKSSVYNMWMGPLLSYRRRRLWMQPNELAILTWTYCQP